MNELTHNPFSGAQPPSANNSGSVAVETERAVSEARGQIQLAKMFPRSIAQATEELLEACKNAEFAASAFYSVPNRGSGPSIRFAEEIARCYGNFEYGHRELSRDGSKSEVEVYAWDKEKNNYSKRQITVNHIQDTRQGPKKLTSEADIDNRIANVAAKQMRGRILALVSKSLVATGIAECKKTLAGQNQESIGSRVSKMISAFSQYGVKSAHLESYLGHSLDDANSDDLADLIGVFNALREGARVSDYFEPPEKEQPAVTESKLGKKAAESKPDPEPEKKPAAKKTEPKKKPDPEPEQPPAEDPPESGGYAGDGEPQGDDGNDLF
jgi:hypothetical protein